MIVQKGYIPSGGLVEDPALPDALGIVAVAVHEAHADGLRPGVTSSTERLLRNWFRCARPSRAFPSRACGPTTGRMSKKSSFLDKRVKLC